MHIFANIQVWGSLTFLIGIASVLQLNESWGTQLAWYLCTQCSEIIQIRGVSILCQNLIFKHNKWQQMYTFLFSLIYTHTHTHRHWHAPMWSKYVPSMLVTEIMKRVNRVKQFNWAYWKFCTAGESSLAFILIHQ